ncbi:MAG: oligosaccharide flippase family protein [Paracoccus sp. (in: a-proteobacteria)]|nr:oligosaccharide flippase family protein [Paracoccus sp. (in: a-proteobacteria)]
MRSRLKGLATGEGLVQRAFRGSAFTIIGFGGQQGIRLASNLILTRLLFPEVFGIMAIIMVVIQGLNNFSDMGISPAIMQSRRGDDQRYLNTAFTMQVIRGVVLWLGCCAIALPMARFYDVPELAWFLPVAGLVSVIQGLTPTKVETANRHIRVGRLTAVELAGAVISTTLTVAMAAVIGSAWALVIALVLSALVNLALVWWLLPGAPNRFEWDRSAAAELIAFGKWILPSTILGFALAQGDKAILGRFLTMSELGIYNIAFFLASFPLMLGTALVGRLMIPVYRNVNEDPSARRWRQLRRMRFGLTGAFLSLLAVLAILGPQLVDLLYDNRYAEAGPLLTLVALATIPQLIGMTYDSAALAAGNSRGFFWLMLLRATLFISFFLIGAQWGGIPGALLGQAMAAIAAYPFLVGLARKHGIWDWRHDLAYGLVGAALAAMLLG